MHVGQALKRLKHEVSNLRFDKELLSLFVQLVDVQVEILKYKDEGVLFFDDFLQLDNVWVGKSNERFNLSQINTLLPIEMLLFHLLHGHHFLSFSINGL